jgi:predicted helicase
MAPYAVSHLKLGLQLQETGYTFETDQRLGIYLTNTLEQAAKKSEELIGQWISDEANAAAEIKRDLKIFVVLGNPPYSGISANRGKWITDLLQVYREVDGQPLGEKKVWLKNDYVKFIRFGQWRIEQTGFGILAFITDHSYLDSPTFRGMREKLLKAFDEIFILNLHGNQKRRELTPEGGKDVNVFDITQGVAISIFVKQPNAKGSTVSYSDLFGLRQVKYDALLDNDVSSTKWQHISPHSPTFDFVPVSEKAREEYEKGIPVREIFSIGSNGVQTSRDNLVVAFDAHSLETRLKKLLDENTTDAELRTEFFGEKSVADYKPGDTREWTLPQARIALEKDKGWKKGIVPYLYRPLDLRFLFYRDYMVDWPRRDVMENLEQPNMVLCVGRAGLVASGEWNLAFAARQVCDHNLFYRGSSLNLPLYIYPKQGKKGLFDQDDEHHANVSASVRKLVGEKLGLGFKEHGSGDLKKTVGPEDIYHYVYAMLYAPNYRERYAEFLSKDFPRVTITSDLKLFGALVEKGRDLTSMHFMDSPILDEFVTAFPEKGDDLIEKVAFVPKEKRVWINGNQFFESISEEQWGFQIGGY